MIPTNKQTRGAGLLCLLLVLAPFLALAHTASLSDMTVTNTGDHLRFDANITNAFTEEMINAAQSGVKVTFSFFIEVNQVRWLWPDKEIASREVTQTLKYDNLKEKYIITRSWEDGEPMTTDSFQTARETMCKIKNVAICDEDLLNEGGKYQVKAKAKLDKLTLPYYLHYVLFFVSFWDVETDWHITCFTY